MTHETLVPHLFRTEYRKIVSVLCKRFGFHEIDIAEDIASDTFLTAMQTWGIGGMPDKPVAWLYAVAKNKAVNFLQRQKVSAVNALEADANAVENSDMDIDLSPGNINDSQLQMMFTICQPSISTEAQIALSLRVLCGFGIDEIADAFLTHKDTINKRLHRAKEKLREEKVSIEFPDAKFLMERLGNVLSTIYLLFNEGYHSASDDRVFRKDLCLEAMRLCTSLIENEKTDQPEVNALMSLMCFHASRFEARVDGDGELILYDDQDVTLWNTDLIGKGGFFLNRAAKGERLSRYHLEAGIAYWQTRKEDTPEKWENILDYYNRLLQMAYSPAAALNRTYALFRARGADVALEEAEKLELTDHPFYFLLLGELHSVNDSEKARRYYEHALPLTRSKAGRRAIQRKIDTLNFGN